LMMELGQDMGQFTIWFGINAALNILACMVAPKYMDRFGTRRTLKTGLILLIGAGAAMLALSNIAQAWAFMLPIFICSFGFAFVLGSSAGKALAPFGDRAGTAAALLGLFQMSGAGLMVSLTQRLDFSPPILLTFQMWLVIPGLLILWSKVGRKWHTVAAN
jgi:DHA1 family bicyclomycin/chloramphenicol resistance-like MFS transporter